MKILGNQYQNVLNIDNGALAELELWTVFVLQKRVLKLEENKPMPLRKVNGTSKFTSRFKS